MLKTDSSSQAAHFCLAFRISNFYMALVILQLALGVSLFITLSYSLIIYAAIIQIWIGFFIGLDLLIRYFSQEHDFFKNKQNCIDMFVLGVLVCCMAASQINFTKFLYYHEDSFLSAVFVITRYLCQFIRIISLFKTSNKMLQIRKINDEIDLKLIGQTFIDNDNIV